MYPRERVNGKSERAEQRLLGDDGGASGEGHFCGAAGGIGVAEREVEVVENGGADANKPKGACRKASSLK